MATSDKPKLSKCLELLQAHKETEFLALVGPMISALIHEKPWPHTTMSDGCGFTSPCTRCHRNTEPLDEYDEPQDHTDEPCTVPPPLTDPPEVLAFRLRDKVCIVDAHRAAEVEMAVCHGALGFADWWYNATPCEQILCCLVSRGEIENDPECS